jgi:hypothetical protein
MLFYFFFGVFVPWWLIATADAIAKFAVCVILTLMCLMSSPAASFLTSPSRLTLG